MKKVLALILVIVFVFAFSSVAFALPKEYEGRVKSGAFVDGEFTNRVSHSTNTGLRFWVADGARPAGVIVIPSAGPDENASSNSAFEVGGGYGVSTLYAPGRIK